MTAGGRNGGRCVPVSMGSRGARTLDTDGLLITHARFPAGETLEPHVHERATFAIMLRGSFDLVFPGRRLECPSTTVFTEPAGERHANWIGAAGAEVVVIQPDPRQGEVWRPCAGLLERVHHFRHGEIAVLGSRIVRELRRPDDVTPLALEGLALEMLALGARFGERAPGQEPAWLARARDLIHDRYRERLRIGDIAAAVGIHPAHLGRAFRARYGTPIGAYVRALRLAWAAERLEEGEEPLSAIAAGAGFADQSHFTRAFRRWTGRPPGEHRRAAAGRPEPVDRPSADRPLGANGRPAH